MKKLDLGSLLGVLANIGVLVGVLLLVLELSQNTQQLRLQLEFDAHQNIFENNRDLIGPDPTSI